MELEPAPATALASHKHAPHSPFCSTSAHVDPLTPLTVPAALSISISVLLPFASTLRYVAHIVQCEPH